MPKFHPGQLVLDPDGQYAIVLHTLDSEVELFLSNGLRVMVMANDVRALGLRPGDNPDPPASFAEITAHEKSPLPGA